MHRNKMKVVAMMLKVIHAQKRKEAAREKILKFREILLISHSITKTAFSSKRYA